jgi:hypothetical protein
MTGMLVAASSVPFAVAEYFPCRMAATAWIEARAACLAQIISVTEPCEPRRVALRGIKRPRGRRGATVPRE